MTDDKSAANPTPASIEALIPHRPPMLLVDEIVDQDEHTLHARKTFKPDEFFTQGHFPDYPLVPGVILCECALQAGAVLLAGKNPASEQALPVATRLDAVKFKQMVKPGDRIDIHIKLNDSVANAYFLTGKITCEGKLAARLDFACTLTEQS